MRWHQRQARRVLPAVDERGFRCVRSRRCGVFRWHAPSFITIAHDDQTEGGVGPLLRQPQSLPFGRRHTALALARRVQRQRRAVRSQDGSAARCQTRAQFTVGAFRLGPASVARRRQAGQAGRAFAQFLLTRLEVPGVSGVATDGVGKPAGVARGGVHVDVCVCGRMWVDVDADVDTDVDVGPPQTKKHSALRSTRASRRWPSNLISHTHPQASAGGASTGVARRGSGRADRTAACGATRAAQRRVRVAALEAAAGPSGSDGRQ